MPFIQVCLSLRHQIFDKLTLLNIRRDIFRNANFVSRQRLLNLCWILAWGFTIRNTVSDDTKESCERGSGRIWIGVKPAPNHFPDDSPKGTLVNESGRTLNTIFLIYSSWSHNWRNVSISSCNGLVPSISTPLPEIMSMTSCNQGPWLQEMSMLNPW